MLHGLLTWLLIIVNTLKRLNRLSRRLDDRLIELGILSGMLVGGAIHAGTNAAVKKAMSPKGGIMQRIGSSIFQKGVRDKAKGKMIHPAIQKVSDVLIGPEASHIYNAGLKSNRAQRKILAKVGEDHLGDVGKGVRGIAVGRRSKLTDRILNRLKSVDIDRGHKKSDWIAGAAAGAGAAVVDPVLPAINAARTAVSNSKLGKRFMKKEFLKGARDGSSKGVGRTVQDYLVSPSLGLVRDAGSTFKA